MGEICRDIFRAVHEGKWLSIEYRNKDNQITKYWIGITDIDVRRRAMAVEGLHLAKYAVTGLNIYIDSIISSAVIEGSYYRTNGRLVNDIAENPHKYRSIFNYVPNLKVLNYLEDCSRLDSVPFLCNYSLIKYLDRDCLTGEYYELDANQFKQIVAKFQYRASNLSLIHI